MSSIGIIPALLIRAPLSRLAGERSGEGAVPHSRVDSTVRVTILGPTNGEGRSERVSNGGVRHTRHDRVYGRGKWEAMRRRRGIPVATRWVCACILGLLAGSLVLTACGRIPES